MDFVNILWGRYGNSSNNDKEVYEDKGLVIVKGKLLLFEGRCNVG
jgi:hypothetical protein